MDVQAKNKGTRHVYTHNIQYSTTENSHAIVTEHFKRISTWFEAIHFIAATGDTLAK